MLGKVIVKGNSRQNWHAVLSQERASIEGSSYVPALSDPTRQSQNFARFAVLHVTKPLWYSLVTYTGSAVDVSTRIRSMWESSVLSIRCRERSKTTRKIVERRTQVVNYASQYLKRGISRKKQELCALRNGDV